VVELIEVDRVARRRSRVVWSIVGGAYCKLAAAAELQNHNLLAPSQLSFVQSVAKKNFPFISHSTHDFATPCP
jgi:hypothetical protein